jgi:hypothetical protein
MADNGISGPDQDLLARLNALKKTHIDLDDKKYGHPLPSGIVQDARLT